MMRMLYATASVMSFLVVTMIGCAPTQLGENWGTAYQTARQNQTLNPDAGENLDSVVGMEGLAAATAMETYRQTFEKPDAQMQKSLVTTGVQTR